MPHGLFQSLSNDKKILIEFLLSFLFSFFICGISAFVDEKWLGFGAFLSFWSVLIILDRFFHAYRRALVLVNPLQQIELITQKIEKDLKIWAIRAERLTPLFPNSGQQRTHSLSPQPDLPRVAYFQANPGWTTKALQGVDHAVSFARRSAEHRDYEISAAALEAIISINSAYVKIKGKTFFANDLIIDNPLSSDGFINDTLEHLRQTVQIAVTRGDEEQMRQTLRAIAALVRVYLEIDYARPSASKSHALLAAGYLSNEVERIAPHNLPDVLMEGVRVMGQCAKRIMILGDPNGITDLMQKITNISCTGAVLEKYQPVSIVGVEQIAHISFNLLRIKSRDIGFIVRQIRENMKQIAQAFLSRPDTPLMNTSSICLKPYYSSTNSLTIQLSQLLNAVIDAPADDANAQQVIKNFAQWADGMYQTEKEIFLYSIEKKSHFTLDMIHWITDITMMLICVSNAAACDQHMQRKLRKHAAWLIAVFSWIPDNQETVTFIEIFQMTETLFKTAVDAHKYGCAEIGHDIRNMLLFWMFKAGSHQSGWAILEKSVCGLAALTLLFGDTTAEEQLKAEISTRLAAGELPDQENRDHTALEIRGRAASLDRSGHWSSTIEAGMARCDSQKLQTLLEEIADLLSPETKGQAAHHGFF